MTSPRSKKDTRFPPGRSGCPSGGWVQRRANEARRRKEEEELRQRAMQTDFREDAMRKLMAEPVTIIIKGEPTLVTMYEAVLRAITKGALSGEAAAVARFFAEAARSDKVATGQAPTTGVLVVYAPSPPEQWEKDTEGEQQDKDPLAGTGYAGGPLPKKTRGGSAD